MGRFVAWRGHALLGLAARLYLGGVFLFACFHKILDPSSFALDVATYEILPLPLVNLAALVLPFVELLAGVLLVLGLRTRAAALLILGMMAVFIAALASALSRGLEMSCGCFASAGGESDPISGWTLVRDGAWLLLAAYVLLLDRAPLGLDRLLARRRRGPAAPAADQ
jgi:putative oxidoreductase